MFNLPPELGSPDVWAGGGVGLFAGLLLRYVIVRVFIVFRLFGREWSFDLKDRTSTDNHTAPPLNSPQNPYTISYRGIFSILCYILKNSLTEPESRIYQTLTSLTVIFKSSYSSISCN